MRPTRRAARWVATVVGCGMLLALSPTGLYAQIVNAERELADAAFLERRYDDSAVAYRKVVQTDATDAEAWFRLGYSLHADKQYSACIAPYRKAIEMKYAPLVAQFNIACAYALMNETERALDALETAVAKGYNSTDQIEQDVDLLSVRNEPRFREIVRRSEAPTFAFSGGRLAEPLFGLWALDDGDGGDGTMTGNYAAKGFAFHLEAHDQSGRLVYLMLTYSAREGRWHAVGADRDGGLYDGPVQLTDKGLTCTDRLEGGETRVTVELTGSGQARLVMESNLQGNWRANHRFTAINARAQRRSNGGR